MDTDENPDRIRKPIRVNPWLITLEFIEFGRRDGAEVEFCDGGGVVAEIVDEGVVAEVTATAGDDYEVSGGQLFEGFRVGE